MFISSTSRTSKLAIVVAMAGTLVGCPSPQDQRAQEGLDALARCDVRGAHAAFGDAWSMDEARSDIALAYALTDLATLVEDPAFAPLAMRLGFDRPLDTALLWGPDGLLDRLSRDGTCETLDSWHSASFPHPSARDGGPVFWDTVDPTLTLGDLRTALVAVSPRLERTARALRLAADNLEGGGVTVEGGCGVAAQPTRVSRPELLAAAAALETVRALAQLSRGYDGSLPFRYVFGGAFGDDQAWTDAMNAGFLVPTDPAAIAAARPMFERAASLTSAAVVAAREARSAPRPSDAIFDWTQLRVEVLDDVGAFATAIQRALERGGHEPIPRVSPTLSIDLASFFTEPFDGTAEGPIWSVEHDPEYGYTWVATSGALERLLAARFDADPWDYDARYEWMSDWSNASFDAVFDPGGRWSMGYGCR